MLSPLHIAIDASRANVAHSTGTEHYARELLRALILHNEAQAEPCHLDLYFRQTPAPDLLPPSRHVTPHLIAWPRLWTHGGLAGAIWRKRPAVTFVPAHTLPFVFPGPAIVTVHDLGYRFFPQTHPWRQRVYLDLTTRYSASRARVVLADSQATRADLHAEYGIPLAKIRVVYPGVAAPFIDPQLDVHTQYGLPARYILFIGTLQPRKNIARLVQAFDLWRRQADDDQAALVLAGAPGWLYDPAWFEGVPNIIQTGYLSEAHKGALLAGAACLLFPSLYEGFGFPVLEAMHCGTPVIASRSSSLGELVQDAGLLVDPLDVQDIALALSRLLADPVLAADLVERGFQRVRRFTWEEAARTTYEQFLLCVST